MSLQEEIVLFHTVQLKNDFLLHLPVKILKYLYKKQFVEADSDLMFLLLRDLSFILSLCC